MVVEKIDLFFIEKLNKRDYQFKPAGWFFISSAYLLHLVQGVICIFIMFRANWAQNIVAGGENASKKIVTSVENRI